MAALLALAALSCSSCSRGGQGGRIDIAMVLKALDSEFWQRVKAGGEQAAKADPQVRLSILAPPQEINIDQQVSIIEDQVLKKVAALAVAPGGAAQIAPALNKAAAAEIPVVILDTDLPWPQRKSFVGIDNKLGGKMAGEYIIHAIGGKGRVAVIRGVLGVSTMDDRVAGFQQAVAAVPGVEIVAVQPANSERALGMGVMENYLTAHPDIKAVFCANDQMALGAMEAVAARHLTGKIVLVGFDATREALKAIEAGGMNATMAQDPEAIGRRAIEQAIKSARGQPVEPYIDIGTALVTKENLAQYLKKE
jgi:ribose transport system substrate-binding protein